MCQLGRFLLLTSYGHCEQHHLLLEDNHRASSKLLAVAWSTTPGRTAPCHPESQWTDLIGKFSGPDQEVPLSPLLPQI